MLIKKSSDNYVHYDKPQVAVSNANKRNKLSFFEATELEVSTLKEILPNKKKIIVEMDFQFYHLVLDTFAVIISEHGKNPESHFIIDSSFLDTLINNKLLNILVFFQNLMDFRKISYNFINFSKGSYILNNFSILDDSESYDIDKIDDIYNASVDYALLPKVVPYRKIYLGRRSLFVRPWSEKLLSINPGIPFTDDSRMHDESKLYDKFESLGYEIVYMEDFKNFKDRLEFLNTVKILVSPTGSGLVNSIFMQPGTMVVELSVPLGFLNDEGDWKFDWHDMYGAMTHQKRMLHLSLPAVNKDPQEIIGLIENTTGLLELIS